MEDWDGLLLDEANSKKDQLPKFVPLPQLINLTSEWGTSSKVSDFGKMDCCVNAYACDPFLFSA